MPRKIVVEPHNPCWADLFKTESAFVAQALAPNVVAIHHIGSTAIPTIYAKPIIDLLIEVTDIVSVDAQNPAMEALGYEAMGEYGIPGRRYFRKDDDTGIRTYHAHCFVTASPEVERHLAFRDFMLAHDEIAQQYSDLKQELAQVHPDDIDSYMDGKDGFIKDIDVKAAAWRASHGHHALRENRTRS